jgi:cellulose synthase (UDP-forming)
MFSDLWSLLGLLGVLAFTAWSLRRISPQEPAMRWALCMAVLAVNALYLLWRWSRTLPPDFAPQTWLAWTYLLIETLALVESGIFWLCMSRITDPQTDRVALNAAPSPQRPAQTPRVEIWIPTYREPLEVLEKSVLAAMAVEYPGLRVKVLDDGNRDWLKAQCQAWGVEHITRPEHQHAKAGNLNHCLSQTEADFVVTMDADFAPFKNFVQRTLPFFADPQLAILQTPQTFYNPDLLQQNLGLGGGVADEQALFFREIQPSRDAWDSAFFCGSCAMVRVQAIRQAGGFPTDSITEDLLTTLRLTGKGWKTRYLNERLSLGLAAESIEAFFVQRDRWSRGAIEIMFLPDGPLRNPGLNLMQRLLFLPLYWVAHPLFNLAIMLAPTICLLTGLRVMMIEDSTDVYLLVLPILLFNLLSLTWISRGRFSPIISTALSMLMAVRMTYSAIVGLLGLGSKVFKVTPKGTQISASSDRLSFHLLMGLTLLTLGAMLYAGWVGQPQGETDPARPWLIFLGAVNLLHFFIALALVEDRPRLRAEERFQINALLPMPAGVADSSPEQFSPAMQVQVIDMSANGLKFAWPARLALPAQLALDLGGTRITLQVREPGKQAAAGVVIARLLTHTPGQRQALIQFLFSGRFDPLVQTAPSLLDAFQKTTRAVLKSAR